MSFLPTDYKAPPTSRYMKLEDGENTFRVLSSAIVGWEYWKTQDDNSRRPVRVRPNVNVPIGELEENPKTGELEMPKHFWAFVVWNYEDERIEILELTQKTIQRAITGYVKNPKWGDPKEYDFIVTRTKDGGKTSYTVGVNPKEKTAKEVIEALEATTVNLEALYEGKDPFAVVSEDVDPDEVAKGIEGQKK